MGKAVLSRGPKPKSYRNWILAGMGMLIASVLVVATVPAQASIIAPTGGLWQQESTNGVYYGCTSGTSCADSDSNITDALANATQNSKTVTSVNFDLNKNRYHGRWTGYFWAPNTATYYFGISSDDMS
jgi:hypothetical protein